MGQRIGKAAFADPAKPFANLSLEAISAIWERFNIIAENWGLSEAQFVRIVSEIAPDLEMDSATLDPISRLLFTIMDTDENGIVDALEFIATLAMASGMEISDKIKFAFNCYDFSEAKLLSAAEVTLCLKSTTFGLTKLSNALAPSLSEIEQIVSLAFAASNVDPGTGKLSDEEFMNYCLSSPAISSWVDYFDDVPIAGDEDMTVDSDVEIENTEGGEVDSKTEMYFAARMGDDLEVESILTALATDSEAAGDDFGAPKPWQASALAATPSEAPAELPIPPAAGLSLEWVHGYRSQDVRNNLRYTVNGEVVYHAAGVGVVYSHAKAGALAQQRFNVSHTDDVMCLTVHPDGVTVATGQLGKSASIVVWDSTTTSSLVTLKGFHRRSVSHLAFSPDGRYLASVGSDDDSSVAVYDWAARKLVFSSKNTTEKVLGLAWSGPKRFATCGVKHVSFWTADEACWGLGVLRFRRKRGLFGRKGKLQPVLCIAPVAGSSTDPAAAVMVAGTVSGHLYRFKGRNLVQTVYAHDGPVNALHAHATGLVSGGKDGKVRTWDVSLTPKLSVNVAALPYGQDPVVRSVCLSPDGQKVLVGTRSSSVYELSLMEGQVGQDVNGKALVDGHSREAVRGLATHPAKNEFTTVGDDATLRVWDLSTHRQLRLVNVVAKARVAAYNSTGQMLAVGLGERLQGEEGEDEGSGGGGGGAGGCGGPCGGGGG